MHAEFDVNTPPGQETVNHVAPNGTVESAIRSLPFPGHPEIYSKKDVEKEKELAEIDFYNGKTREGLDIVLIPKTYSTSPGINIHAVTLPAGMSRLSYAEGHTAKSHSSNDKIIAKYKQTIPTHFTYSPSILGYHHLSRFLDTGHVEPAIVRTMDVTAHKTLADLGKAKAMGSNNRKQWTELRALDEAHNNPTLYTEDGKQIPPEAVLINRMILKDNDAGLISGNSAKSYHLLEKISHIDPKTYNRVLKLQGELQKPEVAQWYQTELLFTAADFYTVKNNVDQAIGILSNRKGKGLFLDASLSVALGLDEDKE